MDAPRTPPSMTETQKEKSNEVFKDDLGCDEPQNWAVKKKLGASIAAFGYAFALLYGATSFSAGIGGVAKEFNVSQTRAIVAFSLYFFGIMFAPLYAPHVSERLGRNPLYIMATIGLGVFTLGAGYSRSYTALAACRFFAGLFGGSNAVQIEGTFADVWPALYTNTYYSFIAGAQYFGAATGAMVGYAVVSSGGWRWTQYTTLLFILGALLLGINSPETYRRELVRRKAKKLGQPSPLQPALSGTTFGEIISLTLLHPPVMIFTEPVTMLITLYLGLNFGVLFQFFVSVPAVLEGVAKFTPQMVGFAFGTAIGGTALAIILTVTIEQVIVRKYLNKIASGSMDIEFRLIPAVIGALLMFITLFWIANTVNPKFKPSVPVTGNGFFVAGSMMNLIAFVSYLFDAFGPQGTLSALTAAAVFRVLLAGVIPLTVVAGSTNIGPKLYLTAFGIIAVVFLAFPIILLVFGKKLRMRSPFFDHKHTAPMKKEIEMMREHGMGQPPNQPIVVTMV